MLYSPRRYPLQVLRQSGIELVPLKVGALGTRALKRGGKVREVLLVYKYRQELSPLSPQPELTSPAPVTERR